MAHHRWKDGTPLSLAPDLPEEQPEEAPAMRQDKPADETPDQPNNWDAEMLRAYQDVMADALIEMDALDPAPPPQVKDHNKTLFRTPLAGASAEELLKFMDIAPPELFRTSPQAAKDLIARIIQLGAQIERTSPMAPKGPDKVIRDYAEEIKKARYAAQPGVNTPGQIAANLVSPKQSPNQSPAPTLYQMMDDAVLKAQKRDAERRAEAARHYERMKGTRW